MNSQFYCDLLLNLVLVKWNLLGSLTLLKREACTNSVAASKLYKIISR